VGGVPSRRNFSVRTDIAEQASAWLVKRLVIKH
jgi:hypothetical protein